MENFSGFKKKNKLKNYKPKLVNASSYDQEELVRGVLPDGASLYSKSANFTATPWASTSFFGGGNNVFHTQRPYMPEFDSPDRQFFPKSLKEANSYWRLFYKADPVFGTAMDMYSTMMFGEFDISLENGVDETIKNKLMDMCERTLFLDRVQTLVREFLVLGEAFPHNFFDESLGIWSYIGFHNPDNIEVIDSPVVDMDPIINYIPDQELKDLLNSNTPESFEIRKRLPSSFISKVLSNQKIRISPVNCSFIPRKLHPYDLRGTSLGSRLWRIWMVEDAVYNSTIATFRRNAAPLKVVKLGDPNTGFIPSRDSEQRLLYMLSQAEMDPNAYLVYNYAINFEAWGTNDRAVTLSREHDTIEKVKLAGLGLSKSFLSGEISFASAKSGLQVFLRRLLSLRQFFESYWIQPKFFDPIIQINDWKKSTEAELSHRVRIRKNSDEADSVYLSPKIKWKNKLDYTVDTELINAYMQLRNFGFKVSKESIGSAVGLDWRDELNKSAYEFVEKDTILEKSLGEVGKRVFEQDEARTIQQVPGAPGSGAKPPSQKTKSEPGTTPVSKPPGNSDSVKTPLSEDIEPISKGDGNSL
jgi:hypothetical protein